MSHFIRISGVALLTATALPPLWADTTVSVSTYAELVDAVYNAGGQPPDNGQYTIQFTQDLSYDGSSATNLFTLTKDGSPLVIDGGGYSLDMLSADRAFFVVGGNVTIQNMEIANAVAKGGSSNDRAGGGMGAGGAIFVADGGSISDGGYWTPTALTVRNVTFTGNQALGGSSTYATDSGAGGGGGLGGDGGSSYGNGAFEAGSGGGGGGVGLGGSGGDAFGGGANDGNVGDFLTAGYAGSSTGGQSGGLDGGGGGAYYDDDFFSSGEGAAGGGGVGGADGAWSDDDAYGGVGGWGGGGGGAGKGGDAGSGGFGGGGGAASSGYSGNGGFGGGGGGADGNDFAGQGGFGAGDGAEDAGGGGLGAGGAIYAMKGVSVTIDGVTFNNNSTTGGTSSGAGAGLAIGNEVFLGSDVVFNVDSGETLTLRDNSLGGAGFSGAGDDANDDAKGRLTVSGGGEMIIQGSQSFVGTTFVDGSTYTLDSGATSSTSDYQVYGSGAVLNVNYADGSIAPITQSGGTVNISASGNTIASNAYTPAAITDVVSVSGGDFNVSGDNTQFSGTVFVSGTGTLHVIGANTTFNEQVTVDGGEFSSDQGITAQKIVQSGGVVDLAALTSTGNINIMGGQFTVGGFTPTDSPAVNVSNATASFEGGAGGQQIQFNVNSGGNLKAVFNFENSDFHVYTPQAGSDSLLEFRGVTALTSLQTMANSIVVDPGATLRLTVQTDPEFTIYGVTAADVTIFGESIIEFNLAGDTTVPMRMDSPTGTLSFKQFGDNDIVFRLTDYGDTLAEGESIAYTLIDFVQNIDLDGRTSEEVLSTFIFDPGEYTGLTATFSGLDSDEYIALTMTITNNVPEPGHYAVLAGLAMLGWAVRRRRS